MKKIISALLMLTMIFSIVCVSASAATVYVNQNFDSEESFLQQFMPGAFYVEDGILCGYSEARALQSNYELSPETYQWCEYDMSITLAVADDELNEECRFVSLVYCNDGLYNNGLAEGRVYMGFYYDVDERRFEFGNGLEYTTDNLELLADPVDYEIDTDSGSEYITLGMSIQRNRIRCFFNDELIYDLNDTAGEWYIADPSAVSPFVFWQNGNFNMIDNITIADAGVMYPVEATETSNTEPVDPEATETEPSDDPVASETEPSDDPAVTESEATTAIETEIVTNEDGETEVVTHIVTEEKKPVADDNEADDNEADDNGADNKPAPDTNTGKPTGGNSTTTGDISFVVVAAMVTALGAALIVRKVSVK